MNKMYRPATFGDFKDAPKYENSFISKAEAFQVPEGKIFLLNDNKFYVKAEKGVKEIVKELRSMPRGWKGFFIKEEKMQEIFGKENVIAIRFEGSLVGSGGELPPLPIEKGSYHTHGNGWGSNFTGCTAKEGQPFLYKGKKWICVYKSFSKGDAWCFSCISVIAIKVS